MSSSLDANPYNRQKWESAEFPVLCQTCLGPNPFIRMTKEEYGRECKICDRPFTIFRWQPGPKARFKKTEICVSCSKLKNVCQTCLLDLEYGLPTQVRDAALGIEDDIPKSNVNREYYTQNMDKVLANTDGTEMLPSLQGKSEKANSLLLKLQRTQPYYKRNAPHICSFWVKGECKRGEECPYRHETPLNPNSDLAKQNFRDRYYGNEDPVAKKMLRRAAEMPSLKAPVDTTITTLYVGGVEGDISEEDLREHFCQYGHVTSVSLLAKLKAAFVKFATRQSAEMAVNASFNKLSIKGRRLKVLWGKGKGGKGTRPAVQGAPPGRGGAAGGAAAAAASVPADLAASGMVPPAPPAAAGRTFYPSMDSQRDGTRAEAPQNAMAYGSQ